MTLFLLIFFITFLLIYEICLKRFYEITERLQKTLLKNLSKEEQEQKQQYGRETKAC